MKDKRTMIVLSIKAPTIVEPEKYEAIRNVVNEKVVVPLNCDPKVRCAYNKYDHRILDLYIFKDGQLKKSVAARLERIMKDLGQKWRCLLAWTYYVVDVKSTWA